MNILEDLLSKPTKLETPAVEPSESPPLKPANPLEQAVHDAPPVATQLLKTEGQLRQEALRTMNYLETARGEKGNFCLTLGEGDGRAILLVAPVEGIKAEDLVRGQYETPDYMYTVTRIDYVLLTAEGFRRISFPQAESSPFHSDISLRTHNDQSTAEEEKLRRIVGQIVGKGKVNLKNNGYYIEDERTRENGDVVVDVSFFIHIPGSKLASDNSTMFATRREKDNFANSGASGVIINDATPLQALENSLRSVQTKLSDTRAQIQLVDAMRKGLK